MGSLPDRHIVDADPVRSVEGDVAPVGVDDRGRLDGRAGSVPVDVVPPDQSEGAIDPVSAAGHHPNRRSVRDRVQKALQGVRDVDRAGRIDPRRHVDQRTRRGAGGGCNGHDRRAGDEGRIARMTYARVEDDQQDERDHRHDRHDRAKRCGPGRPAGCRTARRWRWTPPSRPGPGVSARSLVARVSDRPFATRSPWVSCPRRSRSSSRSPIRAFRSRAVAGCP